MRCSVPGHNVQVAIERPRGPACWAWVVSWPRFPGRPRWPTRCGASRSSRSRWQAC